MVALAPLSDEAAPQLEAVARRMDGRFRTEAEAAEANELWTASSILMGLRYQRGVIESLIQRVRGMRESSTYQLILEEGALNHARRLLLRLGTRKFGAPDEATAAVVNALTDLERLDRLAERVSEASSWAELLAAPGAGSSPG